MSDLPDLAKAGSLADQAARFAELARTAAESEPAIATPEQAEETTGQIRRLRQALKACEHEKESVCKPLRAVERGHFSRWKPAIDGFKEAIKIKNARLSEYETRKAERVRAALTEATTRAEVAQAAQVLAPAPLGTYTREHYSIEIEDESKIPREYLVPNHALLNRLAREQRERLSIPGVRVVATKTAVVRS